MNLPYSDFTPGPAEQPTVAAGGTRLALGICYEDAYGSRSAGAGERRVLVNVTNDAWFGHSWARYQHFQIARMRAIEAQRPLVRAANDGISALVGAHGEVLGAGRAVPAHGAARNRAAAHWSAAVCPLGKLACRGIGPAGRGRGCRHQTRADSPSGTGNRAVPVYDSPLFFKRLE